MKITLVVAMLVLLTAGCSITKGKRVMPDGTVFEVTNTRILWMSEGIGFKTMDTNGFMVELSIRKSRPDVEAISAVAYSTAKGTAEGMKGQIP